MYLRFGDIPEDECSRIYRGEDCVGNEIGVSVYDSTVDEFGNVSVCLPLPLNRNTLDTFRHLVEYENRPCYLVEGRVVGRGSDNEPLIQNVKIVKKVEEYREKLG